MKFNVAKTFKRMVAAVCVPVVMMASGCASVGKSFKDGMALQNSLDAIASGIIGGRPAYLYKSSMTGDYIAAYVCGTSRAHIVGRSGCNKWWATLRQTPTELSGELRSVFVDECSDISRRQIRLESQAAGQKAILSAANRYFPGEMLNRSYLRSLNLLAGVLPKEDGANSRALELFSLLDGAVTRDDVVSSRGKHCYISHILAN